MALNGKREAGASNAETYAAVTAEFVADLERGRCPWLDPWALGTVGVPTRWDGAPFRAINVPLLWMAGARHSLGAGGQWLTYRQAQRAGGQVRGGETASHAVIAGTRIAESSPLAEPPRVLRWIRRYPVFHSGQVDGLAVDAREGAPESRGRRCSVSAKSPVRSWLDRTGLSVSDLSVRYARYDPVEDCIALPLLDRGADASGWIGETLLEACRATGHSSRLARDIDVATGSVAKTIARDRLVSELGAGIVAAHLGLEPVWPPNAAYRHEWLTALRADIRAIFEAATAAQAAADWLLGRAGDLEGVPVDVGDASEPEPEVRDPTTAPEDLESVEFGIPGPTLADVAGAAKDQSPASTTKASRRDQVPLL